MAGIIQQAKLEDGSIRSSWRIVRLNRHDDSKPLSWLRLNAEEFAADARIKAELVKWMEEHIK